MTYSPTFSISLIRIAFFIGDQQANVSHVSSINQTKKINNPDFAYVALLLQNICYCLLSLILNANVSSLLKLKFLLVPLIFKFLLEFYQLFALAVPLFLHFYLFTLVVPLFLLSHFFFTHNQKSLPDTARAENNEVQLDENVQLTGNAIIKANSKLFKLVSALTNFVQSFLFGEKRFIVQI